MKKCADSAFKFMYPAKEQILETPFKLSKKTLQITADWKKNYLKNIKQKSENEKLTEITTLILALSAIPKPCVKLGTMYYYDPVGKTIFLDKHHPSVISALHELGHFLYGNAELEACRFSVWLFKTIFPEFYQKLSWVGHLLVKK